MKSQKIRLERIIGAHPAVKRHSALISENLYAMPLDIYSAETVSRVLRLHPIVVVESVEANFLLIAGFRSYQLAVMALAPETPVNALVHRSADNDQLEQLGAIDMLVSPLLLGLGSKPARQISRLCDQLFKEELRRIHPDLVSSRGINRLLRGLNE